MTRVAVDGAHIIREQEIGLKLPNGRVIFPPDTWHDHDLLTANDREVILALIKGAAIRLGYPEEEFLNRYSWITREKIMAVVYEGGEEMPITSTGVIVGFAGVDEGNLNGEVVDVEAVPNAAPAD